MQNRNAIFAGGIRPHLYCLPILKREKDREALVAAATGGSPRFFLGTDSAPHERSTKENACGCAGLFTAHAALELYAEAFEQAGRLDRLEAFASHFGADFYGLPRNSDTITLIKEPWMPPQSYAFADGTLMPYRGRRIDRLAPGGGGAGMTQLPPITFATRFRGFLPVVIDVETGGFNAQTDALLEIAAVLIDMRSDGTLCAARLIAITWRRSPDRTSSRPRSP